MWSQKPPEAASDVINKKNVLGCMPPVPPHLSMLPLAIISPTDKKSHMKPYTHACHCRWHSTCSIGLPKSNRGLQGTMGNCFQKTIVCLHFPALKDKSYRPCFNRRHCQLQSSIVRKIWNNTMEKYVVSKQIDVWVTQKALNNTR